MILQIIIVTHYFFTRIVGKGNRDEFCIILVDTFLVEREGEKRFSSVLVIRWKNVFMDQKVKWFKRLWICQYKRFQLKKANPNIKKYAGIVLLIFNVTIKGCFMGFHFFNSRGIIQEENCSNSIFQEKKGKQIIEFQISMIRDERPDVQKERLMRLKHSNSKFFKYCKLNLAFHRNR